MTYRVTSADHGRARAARLGRAGEQRTGKAGILVRTCLFTISGGPKFETWRKRSA
jgi:hypothetical protein